MYKLMIVDDEDYEREGMAQFIQWQNYDIDLVGTAWNGVEGLDKMDRYHPDIVFTDIKMPVMDGIEFIEASKKIDPDIVFVVLSGYGEFEYTSKAMLQGVKYYLLKPCDEKRIVKVLSDVKEEIKKRNQKKKREKAYDVTVNKLLPRAREQVFCNILLNREQIEKDYQLFCMEMGQENLDIFLLAFRYPNNGFDYLEQFILENVLNEMIDTTEEGYILSASVGEAVIFLMYKEAMEDIEKKVNGVIALFFTMTSKQIKASVSRIGKMNEVDKLYQQIARLFYIGEAENESDVYIYEGAKTHQKKAVQFLDYEKIKNAKDHADVLNELYMVYLKLIISDFSQEQKKEMYRYVMNILLEEELENNDFEMRDDWGKIEFIYEQMIQRQNTRRKIGKKELRVQKMLLYIYRYLQNPNLSIRFLATEVMFMNEDYLGRLFNKCCHIKFSRFLLETKIGLAQGLIDYDPGIKIAELAQLLGYAPDGQYFSKAFRKVTLMTPSEYKIKHKNEN